MAYNYPRTSLIVLRSRVSQPATSGVLSLAAFTQIDIGSQYVSGSPATNFTCPYEGHYEVHFENWSCGVGTGEILVTSTRSATPVYNQSWLVESGCFSAGGDFVIPNAQVGDVITVQATTNTTGTLITSITDTSSQAQCRCTIKFYPSF